MTNKSVDLKNKEYRYFNKSENIGSSVNVVLIAQVRVFSIDLTIKPHNDTICSLYIKAKLGDKDNSLGENLHKCYYYCDTNLHRNKVHSGQKLRA